MPTLDYERQEIMEIRMGNKFLQTDTNKRLMYGENSAVKNDMTQDKRNFANTQTEDDGSVNVLGFKAPPPINFDTEEMKGSIQFILSKNIGEYVLIEFLIGTETIVRKQGILYYVGTSYVTLYDNERNNFIVCDIFSVKFVYFYFPGDRPEGNFNIISSGESFTGQSENTEKAKNQVRNMTSKGR